MKKENPDKNENLALIIISGVLLLGIILVVILGLTLDFDDKRFDSEEEFVYDEENKVLSMRSGVKIAFGDVIVGDLQSRRVLQVFEAPDTQIPLVITDTGFMGWEVFKKVQTLNYTTSGYYTVDLGELTNDSVSVNEDTKEITIYIPHAELGPIEIDFSKFTASDIDGGLLAWGTIKFTPDEYNQIQVLMVDNVMAELTGSEYLSQADAAAVTAVKDLVEPIVKGLDDTYSVQVSFVEE